MTQTPFVVLRTHVQRLVNQICWGVVAGGGTGSTFDLRLGEKVRRESPVPNPGLPQVVREFESAYALFVDGCPWRLETDESVITSWQDDDANDGPLVQGLGRLVGATILRATVTSPAWDLRVEFDNGCSLVMFADSTPRLDQDDYSVFGPREILTVSRGGEVRIEERRI